MKRRKADERTGPGFKANFMPSWPTVPDSHIDESAWATRHVNELNFDNSQLKIGGFQALDFYGDGSIYILNTPGHTIGHL
jgi:glyoxylase-like metal-dependent hydrolase (beta-lactamase superfamily II)